MLMPNCSATALTTGMSALTDPVTLQVCIACRTLRILLSGNVTLGASLPQLALVCGVGQNLPVLVWGSKYAYRMPLLDTWSGYLSPFMSIRSRPETENPWLRDTFARMPKPSWWLWLSVTWMPCAVYP